MNKEQKKNVQYDAYAKYILSQKEVLARILKFTIAEFQDLETEVIMELIEGEPLVSKVSTEPGETNQTFHDKITGNNTENTESASTEIGKSVEESKNEINNTANETTNGTNITKNNTTTNSVDSKNKVTTNNTNTKAKTTTKTVNSQATEKKEEKRELNFAKPVDGEVSRDYAKDNLIYSETLKEWVTHLGIDIKADKTTVVKAAEAGTVKSIKNDPRYGLTIVIDHGDGMQTVYANLLTSEFVVEGEKVEKGQSIGTVGNTAVFEIADEPHLHFEILKDSIQVDPNIYLK